MERYRTTIIMVGILIVLAGLAFFLGNQNQDAAGTPTPVPQQYAWQLQEDVTAIDVVSGTTTVSVRKDPTSTVWSLLSPFQDDADAVAAGNAADSLKNLLALNVITNATDLAQYGLDRESMKVTIGTGADHKPLHTLMIGTLTIDQSGYYAKTVVSPTVYVLSYGTIEPLKGWLNNPPKVVPTATPLPVTIVPTPTFTPFGTPAETASPGASGTVTGTSTLTSTTEITDTTTITATGPGAANPTTPESTPLDTPTP